LLWSKASAILACALASILQKVGAEIFICRAASFMDNHSWSASLIASNSSASMTIFSSHLQGMPVGINPRHHGVVQVNLSFLVLGIASDKI